MRKAGLNLNSWFIAKKIMNVMQFLLINALN